MYQIKRLIDLRQTDKDPRDFKTSKRLLKLIYLFDIYQSSCL